MKFSLSAESRKLIQKTTNLDFLQQRTVSISKGKEKVYTNSEYKIKELRDVAPRGSIYLQMGRIMSLRKVKSYLKKI
ncbi:MAG: hypothetical protein IJY67_05650 [Paludibacteraceae bacterium]|nr:hypothetical protein [Paludibacteraceae bacterium]